MKKNAKLNDNVIKNFKNVKLWFIIPPLSILVLGLLYITSISKGNFTETYVELQKDIFFFLNGKLSQFPNLEHNLTQLGDLLVFFPLISIFIVYAPKIWECILTSSIIALIASAIPKRLFAIPRPAVVFDNSSFTIVGLKHIGFKSFPSGHSIATFVVVTILLYAFMPRRLIYKILWSTAVIMGGLLIASSRVGVGAHYPLDVVAGSLIGYTVSVLAININNKTDYLKSAHRKRYRLLTAVVILAWIGIIVQKIFSANLVIFYIALVALFITLYLILKAYVQKRNTTNTTILNN